MYGDLLGKASITEYWFLLFRGAPPTPWQAQLLETLMVALANPGIRDGSVRAAMNGGAPGSTWAACLTAALAVGAGRLHGGQELAFAMQGWAALWARYKRVAKLCDAATRRTFRRRYLARF